MLSPNQIHQKPKPKKKSSSNADLTINFNLTSWQSSFHAWAALGEWPSIHLSRTITVHHSYHNRLMMVIFNSEGTKKKEKKWWLWFNYKSLTFKFSCLGRTGTVTKYTSIKNNHGPSLLSAIASWWLFLLFRLGRKKKKEKKRWLWFNKCSVRCGAVLLHIYLL